MTPGASSTPPTTGKNVEVWGGVECTVNRIEDRYIDQIELCGHASRLADLDLLAGLGIKALRYPVLWERIAPGELADADWSHSDQALNKLRELGVTPIAGLVHHGSGPRHTSLLDPAFPQKLADFALAVARRYPWIENYTPINEPLTTARFSCLYGHWYPHAHDDNSFVRAVLIQCQAIRAAMRAIRTVNARARLIQTEDLGKTYSTAALDYQATFDNHRRWLTFDLLTGRVDEWHPLWWYLLEAGAERAELEDFLREPCVPDILGVNHYVTSERFLDDRVHLYPADLVGGNGRHEYADVEAVRSLDEGIAGHRGLLREAWTRYELPIAVTEVHLGCTREHQLRWLAEAWDAAVALRVDGADIRAITPWSLFGSFGWKSLLTRDFDAYEPGAFDVRTDPPRPTALARMIGALAKEGRYDHAALDDQGWWRKDSRFMYPRHSLSGKSRAPIVRSRFVHNARPLIVTGVRGTLGSAFRRIALERGLCTYGFDREGLDITNREAVRRALEAVNPWGVVNAAGYVRVDDAESDAEACVRVNADGAAVLAEECDALGIPVLSFSSDLVFDGTAARPYTEDDAVNPLNVYGATKVESETRLSALSNTLVIRTSAFFGPWDSHNFISTTFSALRRNSPVAAAADLIVSPTYVPDLVHNCLDLLIDDERGIWHLANVGEVSWSDFAVKAARAAGLNSDLIRAVPASELGLRARRPSYSVLGSARGSLMPSLDDAIARYLTQSTTADRTSVQLETAPNV
ncbi:MAG: family 1 glycosylhydrolase [Gemmatimonadaceae bacterium]